MSFSSAIIANPVDYTIAGTPMLGLVRQFTSPNITLVSSAVIVPAQNYSFTIGSGIWLIELNLAINTNDTVDFTGYPFYIRLTDSVGTDVYMQTANLGGTFPGVPSPTLYQNLMTFDVAYPKTDEILNSNQPYTVQLYGEYAGANPTVQLKVYCYKLA
jgi:hypothetical protein